MGAAKSNAYTDRDFVFVQDAAGVVQVDQVPKAWVGTDLLPEGFKAATKAAVADQVDPVVTDPPVDPPLDPPKA